MYHVTYDPHCFAGGWVLKRSSSIHTIRSCHSLALAQTYRNILNDDDDAHALAIDTISRRSLV